MLNRLMNGGQASARAPEATPEVDITQAARARSAGTAQIVDVREPEEWADGHIPGAVHIPLGALGQRTGELDPVRPVITVCRSGNRSLVALDVLREAGITDAKSLAGGMKAWQSAGHPVER